MAQRGRPRRTLPPPNLYPRRTREHIIAHLSVRAVQWLAAKCGYIAEVPEHDYGHDLLLYTFDSEGYPEFGAVAIQLKATDNLQPHLLADSSALAFPVEQRHLRHGRNDPLPVILVIYDVANQMGYWLYVQRHLQQMNIAADLDQAFVTLRVPMQSILDEVPLHEFRRYKELALRRMERSANHGEDGS